MTSVVIMEKYGTVSIITIDNPPVNALGRAVRQGLRAALDESLADEAIEVLILIGSGRAFSAGADIAEFRDATEPPELRDLALCCMRSEKPIVAALHGATLGGGLELALSCNYRVALPGTSCGLPEVKLGIIPGAGGTQRLPRLVGLERALEMIVGGDAIGAAQAKEIGLIDAIIEGDLRAGAIAFAESIRDKRPLPRVDERSYSPAESSGHAATLAETSTRVSLRSRGARAPLRAIAAIQAAVELAIDQGLQRERELALDALASPEAAAMRHAFFAQRAAANIPDIDPGTPVRSVAKAAVIGAGTMGGGVAMVFANAGIEVLLVDQSQELVAKGLGVISKNYAATVKKGRISQAEMDARIGRITATTDWDAIRDADVVVEAVFEEMRLKQDIFSRLDQLCKPDAILASNTSTLDIDVIARATQRPGRVLGLHFFSPANIMRLLEIVRAKQTSKPVVASAMKLAKTLGKVGVLVGVCDGFVGNRMLDQYFREAHFVVEEGASPRQVDAVMERFGMAMGPFATSDLAGVDVGWRIRKAKGPPPNGQRYFGTLPDRLVEMGRYGQKSGRGYYDYAGGSRTPLPDPAVEAMTLQLSKELGIERRPVSDEEILERCLYAMINEAAKILEEKIALRASDIDVVWIHGYGFPAHRGGPMYYANQVGVQRIHDRICSLQREHGDAWQPAALLSRLATTGETFV